MKKNKKFLVLLFLLLMFSVVLMPQTPSYAATSGEVYVIFIEGTIDNGLLDYVERAYRTAEENGASFVLLEIDTPGGLLDSAVGIYDVIRTSPVETVALVTGEAISAGSLLALSAEKLYMMPGTSMGAAEPRIGTETADEKTMSYWKSKLRAAAELHGRDPQVAEAFADARISIPGVTKEGELLTLSAEEALNLKMTDEIVNSREEALALAGLDEPYFVEVEMSGSEKVVRWITNPYVSPFLLLIGIAGLVLEIFTIGFGVFGAVGILSLVLYFAGHYLAGLAGWGVILLFLTGIIFLLVEAFVTPGFGIFGVLGLGMMVLSIVFVYPSWEQAVISLVIAVVGAVLLLLLSIRILPTRAAWQRLVLKTDIDTAGGYVAPKADLKELVGKQGIALTPLRPAGSAQIEDQRVDVVTEGEFIEKGSPIKVVKVEGWRVIVERM